MSTALRESGMEADLIRIDPARNTYRFYRLARLPDYEERGGALVPILVLAHEHDPDPEMRPYTEPVGADRREQLIVGGCCRCAGDLSLFRAASTPGGPFSQASRHLPTNHGKAWAQ